MPMSLRPPTSPKTWYPSLTTLAALACVGPLSATTPIGAFALNDLNQNSIRVGQSVSPRDYHQWISAYYFGNEG